MNFFKSILDRNNINSRNGVNGINGVNVIDSVYGRNGDNSVSE